jgi:hypothetical protein
MTVSLSVSALWLLAMLAAAAHVQDSGRTPGNAVAAAVAFALALAAALWLSPQPNWIAVLLALGVFWRLIAGPLPRVGATLGGASAGLVAALQVAGGVPLWLAAGVTFAALACGFAWGGSARGGIRRRESVLVAVALLVLPLGLLADLVFGWQSATVLGHGASDLIAPMPPIWTIVILGAALLMGLVKGFWVRR